MNVLNFFWIMINFLLFLVCTIEIQGSFSTVKWPMYDIWYIEGKEAVYVSVFVEDEKAKWLVITKMETCKFVKNN